MKDLCFDFETTTYNNGSPFDSRNSAVCVATLRSGGKPMVYHCNDGGLSSLLLDIQWADRLIGFNLKFDLHWLRRLGIDFSGKKVYDPQASEFVLSGQTHRFPSLDDVAHKYLNATKNDEVRRYWEEGYQTYDIPWEILSAYAAKDVDLTLQAAYQQILQTPDLLKKLISLVNQDLLVLEEMEWNGFKFDRGLSIHKAQELEITIAELQWKHNVLHNVPNFNWASNEHLSALLFGGTITEPIKVPVGHFKSGQKQGQVKFKNEVKEHHLPRLYTPPSGTETKKPGIYSVDEDSLASLSGKHSGLIEDLLKIKKMQKELNTYLYGLPKKQDEGFYTDYIYGQFNQCVAATGRLSSSNPNLQNLSEEAGRCLVSRFNDSSLFTETYKPQ